MTSPSQIPAPAWLADRISTVTEQLVNTALPTTADELWRYSRIDSFDRAQFSVTGTASTDVVTVAPDDQDAVVIRRGSAIVASDRLGSLVPDGTDAFSRWSLAAATDLTVIEIGPHVSVNAPIHIDRSLSGSGIACGTRLVLEVGEGASVTVIERWRSPEGAPSDLLALPIVEIFAGRAARVQFVSVQELGSAAWQVGRIAGEIAADATLSVLTVALGGYYARVQTELKAVGRGAHAEILGLYFGEGQQMHDFRTIQEHVAPKTTSSLMSKGAVEDSARSVYSGLIRIGKDARGASANQANRNLLLSPDASAESVPNLEIENNEVKCSHASTVGPIEDDQRYYLESRGVPPDVADRLIVLGFFAEVLERIPDDELRAQLVDAVAQKFDRRTT